MPQTIVIVLSLTLLALALWPVTMLVAYFIVRPFVHPFGVAQMQLLSMPINWPFAAVIVLSVFPLGVFRDGFKLIRPNTIPLYLLAFISVLSWAYSVDIRMSLGQSIKFLSAVCLVLIAVNSVRTRNDVRRIYKGIAFSGVVPMLYGYYQYFTGTGHAKLGEATSRVSSLFEFSNLYGIFLALILFCCLILLVETRSKLGRLYYGLLIVSVVASSLLALNRGSWVAIVLGFLVAYPAYRRYVSLKWFLLAFGAVLVGASGLIIQRFMELEDPYGDTLGARIEIARLIVENFKEIPIMGYGTGTAMVVLDKVYGVQGVPHNDYLRLVLEMGFLAPLIYIWYLGREALSNWTARQSDSWHVGYFTLAMIIYWVVISGAQNIIHDVVVFPMFLVACQLARRYRELSAETMDKSVADRRVVDYKHRVRYGSKHRRPSLGTGATASQG